MYQFLLLFFWVMVSENSNEHCPKLCLDFAKWFFVFAFHLSQIIKNDNYLYTKKTKGIGIDPDHVNIIDATIQQSHKSDHESLNKMERLGLTQVTLKNTTWWDMNGNRQLAQRIQSQDMRYGMKTVTNINRLAVDMLTHQTKSTCSHLPVFMTIVLVDEHSTTKKTYCCMKNAWKKTNNHDW